MKILFRRFTSSQLQIYFPAVQHVKVLHENCPSWAQSSKINNNLFLKLFLKTNGVFFLFSSAMKDIMREKYMEKKKIC